jgi:hypothetical protein
LAMAVSYRLSAFGQRRITLRRAASLTAER